MTPSWLWAAKQSQQEVRGTGAAAGRSLPTSLSYSPYLTRARSFSVTRYWGTREGPPDRKARPAGSLGPRRGDNPRRPQEGRAPVTIVRPGGSTCNRGALIDPIVSCPAPPAAPTVMGCEPGAGVTPRHQDGSSVATLHGGFSAAHPSPQAGPAAGSRSTAARDSPHREFSRSPLDGRRFGADCKPDPCPVAA